VIRVNLLPQKKEGRRSGGGEGGQAWIIALVGAVLLEAVVLVVFHKGKQDELDALNRKNDQVKSSIDEITKQISNHADIKAQLKDLRDREEAISKLQSARSGPTAAMLEISRILTPGRGPTTDRDKIEQLKRDDPAAVPNPNWDPRRLWLDKYSDEGRFVKFSGLARDGEDVSELLRRLTLSDYFYDLKLLPASKAKDGPTGLDLVKFELSAKVRY
jgi:type IV pilus assembly protein PilN